MKINIVRMEEVACHLPEIQRFDPGVFKGRTIDLFLCALGFEPRCLKISECLAEHKISAKKSRILKYKTNADDNAGNFQELVRSLKSISGTNIQELECDEHEFSQAMRDLLSSLCCDSEHLKPLVALDISVCSARLIMRCLKYLLEYDIDLVILYSEAAVYHPTFSEFQDARESWISDDFMGLETGVSAVSQSDEYPGYHVDQVPDCVIVFPSFKRGRAKAVISEVDPSLLYSPEGKVIWILGLPRLQDDRWRLDAMREANEIDPSQPQMEVSTFDYRATLGVLDRIYNEKVGSFRITLSALGSKMQAVGASLFCYLRPDVRVVYVAPKQYNAELFSEGCKSMWIISFGSTAELRILLDRVGSALLE